MTDKFEFEKLSPAKQQLLLVVGDELYMANKAPAAQRGPRKPDLSIPREDSRVPMLATYGSAIIAQARFDQVMLETLGIPVIKSPTMDEGFVPGADFAYTIRCLSGEDAQRFEALKETVMNRVEERRQPERSGSVAR